MKVSKDSVIFDFETLSLDRAQCVISCVAGIRFNEDRYLSDDPYSFTELVEAADFMKFSAEYQVTHYGRKIDLQTIGWWKEKPKSVQNMIIEPKEDDVTFEKIIDFFQNLFRHPDTLSRVYSRGNTFDPIILDGIISQLKVKNFYPHWVVRDTRSMIDGMSFGSNMRNDFVVPGLESQYIAHDPRHDIAMDIMRMQYIVRLLNDLEV